MNELSGGEQQRVAIARALIHRPRLILADEPTGNLDSKTGESILALLQSLRRRFGHTIVMATHSSTAAQQAERVVFMEDGRLQDDAGRVR
jgi:ABC-type lipoprotein export system ATPase subunit